jgi:single-strand DNA-binding protein
MKTKNRVELIGFVGQEPEVRHGADGAVVARLSLATTDRWTDKAGEAREHTEWHRTVFFGKPAEQVARLVKKGALLEVEGSLRSSSYDKDGIKRTAWEIRGFEFRLLDRRAVGEADVGDAPADAEPAPDGLLPDGDLPF